MSICFPLHTVSFVVDFSQDLKTLTLAETSFLEGAAMVVLIEAGCRDTRVLVCALQKE